MVEEGVAKTRNSEHIEGLGEQSRLLVESDSNGGLDYTKLTDGEKWWRDRANVLERRGYRLRPRFRPGWVPSWLVTGKGYENCEDAIFLSHDAIIDATRLSDDTIVIIKRVKAGSDEVAISRMLSSPERLEDSRNHAVPILDYFVDDSTPESEDAFLVMPLLRIFDDPPFSVVNEVIDFVRQMLEGLVYLHDLDIAHRDCSNANLMMDATGLIPGGFHPTWQARTPDGKKEVRPLRRSALKKPIRYYFIDFGISSWFRDEDSGGSATRAKRPKQRLVLGDYCLDKTVPELSVVYPYDPFLLDVYVLGNVIMRTFINKYTSFDFLIDLAEKMTEALQRNRPTAREALKMFESAAHEQSALSCRWRLKRRNEKRIIAILGDAHAAAREVNYQICQMASFILRTFRCGRRN